MLGFSSIGGLPIAGSPSFAITVNLSEAASAQDLVSSGHSDAGTVFEVANATDSLSSVLIFTGSLTEEADAEDDFSLSLSFQEPLSALDVVVAVDILPGVTLVEASPATDYIRATLVVQAPSGLLVERNLDWWVQIHTPTTLDPSAPIGPDLNSWQLSALRRRT